jgi:hypothetical protein
MFYRVHVFRILHDASKDELFHTYSVPGTLDSPDQGEGPSWAILGAMFLQASTSPALAGNMQVTCRRGDVPILAIPSPNRFLFPHQISCTLGWVEVLYPSFSLSQQSQVPGCQGNAQTAMTENRDEASSH